MKIKYLLAFLAISLIWGSTWLVQQAIDPALQQRQVSIAFALAAVILSITALVFHQPFPGKRELAVCVILGVTLITLPFEIAVWAAARVPSGTTAVLLSASPLLAALIGDAPWSARNISVAGIGGVLLVVSSALGFSPSQLPGILAILAGVLVLAGSLIYAQQHLPTTSPVYAAAILLAVAGGVIGFISLRTPVSASPHLTPSLVLIAAAADAVAYPIYFWLLQKVRVDQLVSTVWAQFLFSIVEGMALLHLQVSWRILVGLLIVFASLWKLLLRPTDEALLTLRVTALTR